MIRTYGQGQATSITKRLDHHAEALLPNLYLASGAKLAFGAGFRAKRQRHDEVGTLI